MVSMESVPRTFCDRPAPRQSKRRTRRVSENRRAASSQLSSEPPISCTSTSVRSPLPLSSYRSPAPLISANSMARILSLVLCYPATSARGACGAQEPDNDAPLNLPHAPRLKNDFRTEECRPGDVYSHLLQDRITPESR